ncbi:MAG TPA: spore coat U domain-containing protein [Thermoanaerobaculia bacterium]|nr:spore coat U domain-containing protein [Thermoanaerobaculia bacterium]
MRARWEGIGIGATLLFAVIGLQRLEAASASSVVHLSATVAPACQVTAPSLDFGEYDPLGIHETSPLDAECRVRVTCTRSVSASLQLSPQRGTAADASLISGSDELFYAIFRDAGRLDPWADLPLDGGGSRTVEVPLYARIYGAQDVPSGDYQDTVIVRLDF